MSPDGSSRPPKYARSLIAAVGALAALVAGPVVAPDRAVAHPRIASRHAVDIRLESRANVRSARASLRSSRHPRLRLTRRPSRVPPRPRNRQRRRISDVLSRTAAWDASGQVDAVAYCTQNAYGAWSLGAAHPWMVRPTVAGNQSIAFRFNVYRSDGVSLGSTDWWEGEVDRYGLFHEWARSANALYYKFMNMRTNELYNSVGYTLYPPRGLGYRETITVYWYVNGSWSRSLTVAPGWSTGANPSAYCIG
jgi:hypothetical protein